MSRSSSHDRKVIEISGRDRQEFLQGLVSNDVRLASQGLVYAALLTPQGKYLFDFFLFERGDSIMLDVDAGMASQLEQRLNLYRLRQSVTLGSAGIQVSRGTGDPPEGAWPDPRNPALGWRLYGTDGRDGIGDDWDRIRVDHCIPETGIELIADRTFILEAGFDRLNGVDFRKGCYVGQEVTARMRHKSRMTKGLATVEIEGQAVPGTTIMSGKRQAGLLHTRAGNKAIAYLRFDRLGGEPLAAGDAILRLPPDQEPAVS